jgi:hypothetical protein
MIFTEFKENWENNILPNKEPYLRNGQALMIYLSRTWFKEYDRITMMKYGVNDHVIDYFYVDSIIPKTLNHLEKVWINYPN